MSTAVMRPRPVAGGRSHAQPSTSSQRKPSRSRPSHPPVAENSSVGRNPSSRNVCKSNPINIIMEDVRILKRGETLRPLPPHSSSGAINDPAPCTINSSGSETKSVPAPSVAKPPQRISAYAGSVFHSSPPPSSLPFPVFLKKAVARGEGVGTMSLRCLLLLDGGT